MKIQIFSAEKFKTTNWSGGSTTELFIFPIGAVFSDRDFAFRLSTASVNVENSVLTPLEGVTRQLMVLNGSIQLIHENHHSSQLARFDIDEFQGAWNTQCVGTCEDFNLMTRDNAKGNLNTLIIEKGKAVHYNINDNIHWVFVYAYSGNINIDLGNTTYQLYQGELMAVDCNAPDILNLQCLVDCELIIAQITLQ